MSEGGDDERPGGYSVRGGRAEDVEVFGRRRVVRRHTPRLRLDPETAERLRQTAPPATPSPEGTASGAPPAHPPGSTEPGRLPSFGGAGIVGSAPPPPPSTQGPVITRRGPRPSPARGILRPGRSDDTVPVATGARSEWLPEYTDEESGVLPAGSRAPTPARGQRRVSPTPPLGVELEPPTPAPVDELPGVVHGELTESPPRSFTPPPSAPSASSASSHRSRRPAARFRSETPVPSPGFRPPSSPPGGLRGARPTPRADHVRPDAISSVPPPPPGGEQALPTDEQRARALRILETLRSCGPDDEGPAVTALLKIGAAALEPMEREFPGLLWFHRRVAHKRLPRGRDVGSLARAIVAFGESTAPMLRRIMENGLVDQRFYAVLVAGDVMPRCRREARSAILDSLGRRLRDVDPQVSDVALHVLMAWRDDPAIESLVGSFIVQMGDLSATPADRVFATRVLGVLRCARALGAFVDRLDDPSPQVRDGARKALRLLTGDDHGSSRRKWAAWARKHGAEPRVRWLIEGLLHRDEDLRAMAHRELDKMAAPDFGYSPTMSRGERKRIYRQALAWHEQELG